MVLNFTDPFLTTRVLGFESLFDRLQRFSETTERSSSYPPYNIRRDENRIFIDVAVAGLSLAYARQWKPSVWTPEH